MICLIVVAGKLFHTRGPATAKLLSPRVVRVRGTASVLWEDVIEESYLLLILATDVFVVIVSLRREGPFFCLKCVSNTSPISLDYVLV